MRDLFSQCTYIRTYVRVRHVSGMSIRTCARACVRASVTLQECRHVNYDLRAHACAYIAVHLTPLCDCDVGDEDAIMSVEEGGVEVGESAVPYQRRYAYCYIT